MFGKMNPSMGSYIFLTAPLSTENLSLNPLSLLCLQMLYFLHIFPVIFPEKCNNSYKSEIPASKLFVMDYVCMDRWISGSSAVKSRMQ